MKRPRHRDDVFAQLPTERVLAAAADLDGMSPLAIVRAAAPILAIHGLLVVSEPPGDADRWADAGPEFVRRGGRGPIAVLVRVPRGSLQ